MLALVLVMLLCVACGVGVVGYVLAEARREGRGDFWTPEGEELIAGARRTGEKVRERGTQLSRTAAGATQQLRERRPARRPEAGPRPETGARAEAGADSDLRAAS